MIWGFWGRTDEQRRLRDDCITTALIRQAGWELAPARRVTAHLAARWWSGADSPKLVEVLVRDELAGEGGESPSRDRIEWAVTAINNGLAEARDTYDQHDR